MCFWWQKNNGLMRKKLLISFVFDFKRLGGPTVKQMCQEYNNYIK